jgi:predicted esterase
MRIFLLLGFLFVNVCEGGEIFSEFPKSIDPNAKYVFYSHGLIVEGDNPTPESTRYGIYDFPEVKRRLSDKDYNLIAYHRPKNTNPKEFAKKLADNVLELIKMGVKPKNISLVGFSRGGAITIFTSNLLARNDVTFIILAGCGDYLNNNPQLAMYGHVYSIIETSDELVGPCNLFIDRSENIQSFTELSLSTGKEHGAFYVPLPEWINPVKKWIKLNKS